MQIRNRERDAAPFTTRDGSTIREYVAQIRTALEISQAKVKEQHAVAIEVSPD